MYSFELDMTLVKCTSTRWKTGHDKYVTVAYCSTGTVLHLTYPTCSVASPPALYCQM